ncbi:NTP anaerobic reductase large subunit [Aeromonas phage AS-yj]|uniref:NTP anaerobic reductase large subunit n=2 Tax=Ceceduovirus aszj TaxID=2843652 RepID=A0A223LG93_9CAUD|nr:anaerobic ribonucleoside reductase large subunit [Aeromonas phage AS-zj]ASU00532.1 NTP anaerobic reductase large subunit [Aeromonas phage AS-zj]ATI18046.1 NTP anaerobic reductase large subunit [Aeromonas phage AS-yj]QAX99044.1 NTP anaerobic reductase large subunit [Aeromonas phage Assk]
MNLYKEVMEIVHDSSSGLAKENANKDLKIFVTKRDALASAVSKEFAKEFIPVDVLEAHNEGIIHYHDLGYSPLLPFFNCMLINVKDMFDKGFTMSSAKISKPKNIKTATTLISQIICSVANHIYGGNTVADIDILLAEYVKMDYDKLCNEADYYKIPDKHSYVENKIRKIVYDAIQTLEYQINSLSTSQGQTPFTTLSFGLGDTPEAKLIQETILQVRIDGLGSDNETPVFPKLVFILKDGHNLKPSDPFYDVKLKALLCSSKRMYPDIISYDQVVKVTGGLVSPMGCRSYLNPWKNEHGEYEYNGRQNLGVVTLNLPRIALEVGGDKKLFFALLEERMELVKKALVSRIERFKGVKASCAPILYMNGAVARLNANDEIYPLFQNGRSSVSCGYIGLHEVSEIVKFNDDSHIFGNEEKKEFCISILRKMKYITDRWTDETGFAFSLYGTPSESLCKRFVDIDETKYPHMVHEKGYYTNSFHLDVEYKTDPYHKILFEREFITYSKGGFISYGEFPNMKNNLKALEDVWDFAYKNTPYYGTNTPIDQCFECGYHGEMVPTSKGYECPSCGNHDGSKLDVKRRVCGYLGDVEKRPLNEGKHKESIRRVKHL